MTNPTGKCFVSYKRERQDEVATLIGALHDHGVPTWQDLSDLSSSVTNEELDKVLTGDEISSGLIFITPEVVNSPTVRNIEIPQLIKRACAGDGFFLVVVVAGGLGYDDIETVADARKGPRPLNKFNAKRVQTQPLNYGEAAGLAQWVLQHRLKAIDAVLPNDERLVVNVQAWPKSKTFPGAALDLDWRLLFDPRHADPSDWSSRILPALCTVAKEIGQTAPTRNVVALGNPGIPLGVALGATFPKQMRVGLTWMQWSQGSYQEWSLGPSAAPSGFTAKPYRNDADGRDLAVLISVTADVRPAFQATQNTLPKLAACVEITHPSGPQTAITAGKALDISQLIDREVRAALARYAPIDCVHIFAAIPAGLAVLIGQQMNTWPRVQLYELQDGATSASYAPEVSLLPSMNLGVPASP